MEAACTTAKLTSPEAGVALGEADASAPDSDASAHDALSAEDSDAGVADSPTSFATSLGQRCAPLNYVPGPKGGCKSPLLWESAGSTVDGGLYTIGCFSDSECADSGGLFDGVCRPQQQGEGFVIPRFCEFETDK